MRPIETCRAREVPTWVESISQTRRGSCGSTSAGTQSSHPLLAKAHVQIAVFAPLALAGCDSDAVLFWVLFLLFWPLALAIGLFEFFLRRIGNILEAISNKMPSPPPHTQLTAMGPDGFAVSTSLYVRQKRVAVGEEDFLSWSFSFANPANLAVEIKSELLVDGAVVASRTETTTSSARGFAVGLTTSWPVPGERLVRGEVTFRFPGEPDKKATADSKVTVGE